MSLATQPILRAFGWVFAAAAIACVGSIALIACGDIRISVGTGRWIDLGLGIVVPVLVMALGIRAGRGRLRSAAFGATGLWVLAHAAEELPVLVDRGSYAAAAVISVVRVLGVAAVAVLPSLAVSRRVIPRWPLLATIALAAGDAGMKLMMITRYTPVMRSQFDPSPPTIAICALVAYAFVTASRELGDESIDDGAERMAPITSMLFANAKDRAVFLGPVRLATDATVAFAIATLVGTTTTAAYNGSLRHDTPPAGVDASAVAVVLLASIVWLKVSSKEISFAPVVAALLAAVGSIVSTTFANGTVLGFALLPLGIAVFGLAIVAPHARDTDMRTMRRWVTSLCATGVLLASAGFFASYSYGQGEPTLARLAKLGAVVFGIMAATALVRLERHARIELAAEDREP